MGGPTWDLGHSLFRNKEVKMTTGPGAVPRLGDPVARCLVQHRPISFFIIQRWMEKTTVIKINA